ncbi:MAG: hypothetical protein JSR59_03130 [Proteobacteria bacterium]|nr:hypothetical protein [Pseudomonadota bacterium]
MLMPSATHRRRLRDVWRSAGWPCRDLIEIELLAAGLLERVWDAAGRETLRVTDAGIAMLAETLARNRARRDPHELLVERVAREMQRAGRIAWRGLSLRAKVESGWVMAMPDVYSVRHTTVEAYLQPVVHEIKVQRSDLLSDLRSPQKRAAYLQLGECWYVIRAGIAEPDEIPPECGVLVAGDAAFEVARPAPRRTPVPPGFQTWLALARATPVEGTLDLDQRHLGDPGDPPALDPDSAT